MKAYDLSPQSPLFVARDIIETAKELQTHLASVPLDNRPEMAANAIETLGDPRELYGGKKVYIHTLGSFVLARGLSEDEALYHGTFFADAYLGGEFSKFAYVQGATLKSLCLQMFNTEVLASRTNPAFVGETICSGVYVPVHSIESALAA